ncbi:MAG: DUF4249 domain-containing protein [Dinghuibacter sp.]|nr:DUF4249 domain-containing protein [Dinghuibacter sp.]
MKWPKKIRYVLIAALAAIFLLPFSACEKNISIKTEGAEPVLVVEATIENDQYPVVILSKSMDYFGKITPELLFNSFVRGAVVEVSNGVRTHRLKEYTIPLVGAYSLSYYTVDSANLGTAFKGEINKQYRLTITAEGKNYNATTTIPVITRRIDSIWWKPLPAVADSAWAAVMVRATDKPGLGDYIRYFTSVNGAAFLPGDPSTFDDNIIDGSTYEVQVDKGQDRNNLSPDIDHRRFYKRGDTVIFKLSQIDKETYDFWRTMEFSYSSVGNPFSSPVKVLSNIKGAPALGYFGGYATQFRSVVIPR